MLTIINTENEGVRLQTDNVPILTKLRDAGWEGNASNVFYLPLDAVIVPFVEDKDKSVYITDNGGGMARLEKTITVTFSLDDIAFVDNVIFNDV